MRTISIATLFVLLVSGIAFSQTITGATNAASYISQGLPNGGLAQGGVATIFVQNVGITSVVVASAFPLQPSLGGVSVTITAGGSQFSALPIVLAPTGGANGQVSAIIPSATPTGQATIVVSGPGGTTAPFTVTIVANALGIFALNQGGSGPGIFTNPLNNNAVNLISAAFSTGGLADIWATGLGAAPGNEAAGPIPSDLRGVIDVRVIVGGVEVVVQYAGRSGCCAGLDQIRIVLPANITGCYVPVVVIVNGVPSNIVTISISDSGNICSTANGLTATDITNAQQSGGMNVGTISLNRSSFEFPNPVGAGVIKQTTDTGTASFERYTSAQLFSVQSFSRLFTPGSCILFQFAGSDEEDVPDPGDLDPVQPAQFLDAGTVINIAHSPNGNRTLQRSTIGNYFANLGGDGFGAQQPLFLSSGTYSFDNGSGGADIGGFAKSANFPDPLNWTNKAAINGIPSGQDLMVTWTGGQGTTIIFGGSINTVLDVGAGYFCQTLASAGQFPIPAYIVDAMPASTLEEGIPSGFLNVGNAADPVRFDAPGLDLGVITYTSIELKPVGYHIDVPDPGTGGGGGGNGGNGGGSGGGGFAAASSSFANGGVIPGKHAAMACGGSNVSPQISWGTPPAGTEEIVVIMDDPDAGGFLHWALWGIPGTTAGIPEGNPANLGKAGQNDFGQTGYGGPCPPPGPPHNYRIRVIASPFAIPVEAGAASAIVKQLISQFSPLALGTTTYTGTFGQ